MVLKADRNWAIYNKSVDIICSYSMLTRQWHSKKFFEWMNNSNIRFSKTSNEWIFRIRHWKFSNEWIFRIRHFENFRMNEFFEYPTFKNSEWINFSNISFWKFSNEWMNSNIQLSKWIEYSKNRIFELFE